MVKKPARRAKKLAMGELKARVLNVLWDREGWTTPGEAHEVLSRSRDLAYTTVMTIMVRLFNDGMLERRREGRAFAYRPLQSREEYTADRMSRLLDDAGDQNAALSHFLQAIGPGERARLRRLLQTKRTSS